MRGCRWQPRVAAMSIRNAIHLARLLGAVDLDSFFQRYWEQAVSHAPAAIAGDTADLLTLDGFETLLVSAGSQAGLSVIEGRVARPAAAGDLDPARLPALFDAYRRGCSLLLSGLERRCAAITTLCREVGEQLLGHGIPLATAVQANAYLTPPNSQAFDIHYDNHCALILQLHGEKRWTVFAPLDPLPIERCEQSIARDTLDEPVFDSTLRSGDVLYVPRGFPHCAATADANSLHLTLSLWSVTWAALLAGVVRSDVEFRQTAVARRGETAPAARYFADVLAPALAAAPIQTALQRRLDESAALVGAGPEGRLRAVEQARSIDSDTWLQRRGNGPCSVAEENGAAVLRFPGATLRLPAVMKPVFEFVMTHDRFRAVDLPAIDAVYDPLEFSRVLLRRGLVEGA